MIDFMTPHKNSLRTISVLLIGLSLFTPQLSFADPTAPGFEQRLEGQINQLSDSIDTIDAEIRELERTEGLARIRARNRANRYFKGLGLPMLVSGVPVAILGTALPNPQMYAAFAYSGLGVLTAFSLANTSAFEENSFNLWERYALGMHEEMIAANEVAQARVKSFQNRIKELKDSDLNQESLEAALIILQDQLLDEILKNSVGENTRELFKLSHLSRDAIYQVARQVVEHPTLTVEQKMTRLQSFALYLISMEETLDLTQDRIASLSPNSTTPDSSRSAPVLGGFCNNVYHAMKRLRTGTVAD